MPWTDNPKTKGSGIVCCIPQTGTCPHNCKDCFFQSGRSYLEPLKENLPNMPTIDDVGDRILRVNDGNDSFNKMDEVIRKTAEFPRKFYNTSIPKRLEEYPGPVVLTVNPGKRTNRGALLLPDPPKNLMFVRFRTNTFNLMSCDKVVEYYTKKDVPVVLTFMAYFNTADQIPSYCKVDYIPRKRTTNEYHAITTQAWERVMYRYHREPLVSSCGKIEGEKGKTGCRWCGNCLREYYATEERLEYED